MSKNGRQKKNSGILSVFFTAEVFGMALALLCVLLLLRLAAGDYLFGPVGKNIEMFFFGSLGYFSFPLLIFCVFFGVKMLIGFKVQNKVLKRTVKYLLLYAFFICLILQTATSPATLPLKEYVSYCYNAGTSLSVCTAGGVVLGIIVNVIATYLTSIGAYVVYGLLLVVTTVILLRKNISDYLIRAQEEKPEKIKKKKEAKGSAKKEKQEEKQAPAENSFYTTAESDPEVQEEKPQRRVIFGGGTFEKKDGKKDEEAGAGVKVLFSSGSFNPKQTNDHYINPVTPSNSYRNRYDEDIESKTDFVRRPYQNPNNSFVSPMGGQDNGYSAPLYNSGRAQEMNVDLSEPEKDVYVMNNGGRSRENISPFDRQVNSIFERQNSSDNFDSNNSEYNQDRFSSNLSGDRFTQNDAYNRTERDFNTRGEDFNSRGGERAGFGRDGFGSFNEGENFNAERGFNSNSRMNFGEERNSSDFGSRTNRESFSSREEMGGRDESGFERRRADQNPFEGRNSGRNPFNGERVSSTYSDSKRDDIDIESDQENPLTRAMRESEQRDKQRSQNSVFNRDYNSAGETAPDYNGESSEVGGSFFDAEDRTQKSAFGRDRAHTTHTPAQESKPASSTTQTNSATSSGNYAGKQMSFGGIAEENKLVNPIDNIPKNYKYAFPPITLLRDYTVDEKAKRKNEAEQSARASTICQILNNGNIDAKIEEIKYGPAITRFELSIPPTVSVKRINEKYEDLNLWLAARDKIRLVTPIQGTSRIGVEVPNAESATVGLKSLIETREFKGAKQSSLSFCLGQDIVGRPVILDISKMPHLLVAGATGTGKSVFLNTLLISLIYKYSPEELRIILVDPKVVEFSIFKGMPNLMFNEIFTDNAKVCSMLEWAVEEMETRYQKLNEALCKNIDEYNAYIEKKRGKKIPKLLIIIDEFADLMSSSTERKLMENKISRLAAKARAAGIHLIMATQRPSADIMEGSIKTNFTSRIAFKMSSPTDAMVIMGEGGADKLLGRGDVLFRTSTMPSAERAQGCFVDTPEIDAVCKYVKANNQCYYDELALEKILKGAEPEEASVPDHIGGGSSVEGGGSIKNDEEFYKKAMRIAITTNNISISGLQRKLGVGFPKAAKIVDTLIEKGYISEQIDNKTRKIYMTKEQFEDTFGEPL